MRQSFFKILFSVMMVAASSAAMADPPDLGALFSFTGTGGSLGINGYIYDKDIHSGVFGIANGTSSDSYVLQGGDPYGGDTGDGYEVGQAHGMATVNGFSIETGYDFGEPSTQVGTFIFGNPDTGFLKFTNTSGSAWTGFISLSGQAFGGIYGPAQFFSNSGSVSLGVGDFAYIVLNDESSNYGGYNKPLGGVTPVPEPETYAMMLAGLGLLGFSARRRKQKATA